MIRNVLRVLDNVTYVNIVAQIIRNTKFFHDFVNEYLPGPSK